MQPSNFNTSQPSSREILHRGALPELHEERAIDWRFAETRRRGPMGKGTWRRALREFGRLLAGKLGLVVAVAALWGTTGCGGEAAPGREIAGRVTVDGQPLAHGVVALVPVAPTKGPRVMAPVREGAFHRSAEQGPWPGVFRVEVRATPPDVLAMEEKKRPDQASAEAWANFREIAAEFNHDSAVQVEVLSNAVNQYDFQVRWAPK